MFALIFGTFITLSLAQKRNITVRVGMIGFEKTQPDALAFSRSAGIINYALDTLRKNRTIDQIDFEFYWNIVDCDYYNNAFSLGVNIGFMQKEQVDLFIAGPCTRFIQMAGTLSAAYRIPILTYGYAFQNEFVDVQKYPYLSTIVPTYSSLAVAFLDVLDKYEWLNYSLISTSTSNYCRNMFETIEAMGNTRNSSLMKIFIDPSNSTSFRENLQKADQRSRVWAFCSDSSFDKRLFLIMCNELGYNTTDYLFIILEMRSIGFAQFEALGEVTLGSGRSPFYLDYLTMNADGNDDIATKMARLCIVFDVTRNVKLTLDREKLSQYIMENVRGPPFNCNTTECLTNTGKQYALFALHLHDVFLNYGLAMNKTIKSDGSWSPEELMKNMKRQFDGLTGDVIIDENGNRQANFQIITLVTSPDVQTSVEIVINGNKTEILPQYTDESSMWTSRGGKRPLNLPKCGYLNDECPPAVWVQYQAVFIAVICIAILTVIAGVGSVFAIWKQKRDEQRREDSRWMVPFHKLTKKVDKKMTDSRSMRSLISSNQSTTSTKMTTMSSKNNFNMFLINDEPVIAEKIVVNMKIAFENREEIIQARKLEHDNVNKFIGLVIDTSPQYSLWKNCERGTLREVISHQYAKIDDFFMCSLISDITNGLDYIHRSPLHVHGGLTSKTCFVNDRWQVKISDYGLTFISSGEKMDKYAQLYLAPEILRGTDDISQATDVYAFSIVMSEIVTLKLPYNAENEKGNHEERIYLLKKGGAHLPRPDLTLPEGIEMNIAMLHLIRDCWSEDPSHRPPVETIRSLLKGMQQGKQKNLMDYALAQMEEYASKLELEVEDQTRELTEEKKRSDVLLYRMLPKQVAEKLKLGQSVEPESFDQVTIFFSDVVKFTQLAQKCTPLQIINLLNELFTIFDNLIDEHGVYKVETIGDGYLCVSGLPYRNGTQHVRDIAEMSLDFMDGCRKFTIPHLPHERVQLRIGMNTGPCVAGVVGLTMPRYCLFGDVVNTGSRMESNGKPGMIHMTSAANRLLTSLGGYVTTSRGDVIIKGKGVMETFWLLGRQGEVENNNNITELHKEHKDTPNPGNGISRRNSEVKNIREEVIDTHIEHLDDSTPVTSIGMYEGFRSDVEFQEIVLK